MNKWKQRAACRDFPVERIDDVFFSPHDDYVEARAVCSDCEVRRECGEYGRHERWGIWGGRSPKERGVRDSDGLPTGAEMRKNPVYRACVTCGEEFQKMTLRQRHCDAVCKTNSERKTA